MIDPDEKEMTVKELLERIDYMMAALPNNTKAKMRLNDLWVDVKRSSEGRKI